MPRKVLYRDRNETASNLTNAIEFPGPIDPNDAVPLRAHSIATLSELRKTVGSADGNAGPRVCMLSGQLSPLDAGAGTFVWDPTSTLPDNALQAVSPFTVATVQGAKQGRWRRLTDKVTATLTDAAATIAVGGGSYYMLPVGTLTAGRILTLGNAGAADKQAIEVRVYPQGFAYTINDSAAATLLTVAAGTKVVATFNWAVGTGKFQLLTWALFT